ncbi:MAG: bacillithiol biosynthesis cysteine-adding enzyme BshC [Bacteroidetes bacterium]|nr:bacillithiol biosynthesis cysteine-adding enzyme BshC [Bacteroidota bacterium]
MKIIKSIDICATDYLSKTTKDYLLGVNNQNIFPPKPTLELVYENSLNRKFSKKQRIKLVEILLRQYENHKINLNPNSQVYKNIKLLEKSKTFTFTSGQQIHIFLGPLFFLYKIKSLLSLTVNFNNKYSKTQAVPVFWMATEDHDFEEIRKVKLYGKEYFWDSKQGDAVGRILCKGLPELISTIEERADKNLHNKQMFSMLRKHYTPEKTLAEATRAILHEIFETNGLIIINPDDTEFKKIALDSFEKEITNDIIFTNAKLQHETLKKNGYKPVLNPQKTNYFWLENCKRLKIKENQEDAFEIDGEKKLTLSEIIKTPEKLSPNVLSRAIYQETILPNLVYLAGSTEIDYWLLLKSTFEKMKLPYPVLFLRDSAIILSEKTYSDINKLKLEPEDMLKNINELSKICSKEIYNSTLELEEEIKNIYKKIEIIKSKMTDLGYEKAKIEQNIKGLESAISKIKNLIQNDENILKSVSSNNKLKKIKERFFSSKQERNDFAIEYPELFEEINLLDFNKISTSMYFLSI